VLFCVLCYACYFSACGVINDDNDDTGMVRVSAF